MNKPHQPGAGGDGSIQLLAGVELGGTKCICTLASGASNIVAQEIIRTTDPETTLDEIGRILAGWRSTSPFAALGIASFGPLDLNPLSDSYGHILATSKPGWRMTDVARRLARPLAVPMCIDTDVNGAALAEIRWGSGRGLDDFAYVTVGTGIGVGIVVHGRPVRGIGHSEAGHLRIPRLAGDRLPSNCPYHDDCVEGIASGSALQRALDGRAIATLLPEDPLWDRVVDALGALCHALVCMTAPARIAIGGGVVAHQPHLLPRIERALRSSMNGYMRLPEAPYLADPALGKQSGPLGAIALAQLAALKGEESAPASRSPLVGTGW